MLLVLHIDAVRLRCVEFFDPFFLQIFAHECVVLWRLIDTGDGNVVCLQVNTSRSLTGSCSIYCAAYLQVYASRIGKTPSFL